MSELQVAAIKSFNPGELPEIQDSDGVPQFPFAKAWVNFNGVATNGNYVRAGNLATCTITAHGMETGMVAQMFFITGAGTDGFYPVTVIDANNFTIEDPVSGATSGLVAVRNYIRASHNVSYVADTGVAGVYDIHFTTPFASSNYAAIGMGIQASANAPVAVSKESVTAPTSSTYRITAAQGSTRVDIEHINMVFFGV